MPSLVRNIMKSDILHIPKEGQNANDRRVSSSGGSGSGASPLRIRPFIASQTTTNRTPTKDKKMDMKCNSTESDIIMKANDFDDGGMRHTTTSTSERGDVDVGGNSPSMSILDDEDVDEEDKENFKTVASSNEIKLRSRSKKKRKMTLDAYFIQPSRSKTKTHNNSDDDDDDDDYEYIPNQVGSSKKKQRTTKLLSLKENAKPIHVHIPFVDNDKYVEVRITSHCVPKRYNNFENEPLVLSGEMMYPACSKIAIERFLPGFGRYIR